MNHAVLELIYSHEKVDVHHADQEHECIPTHGKKEERFSVKTLFVETKCFIGIFTKHTD